MKFYKNLIIIFFLFVIFPTLVYSLGTQRNINNIHCVISKTAPSFPAPFSQSWKVLDLFGLTNSHAAFSGVSSNYQYHIYCNFGGGDNNCLPKNKNAVVYLTGKTNSHVQAPDLLSTNPSYSSLYSYPLCYSDIVSCSSIPSTANCDATNNETEFFVLDNTSHSADTNDHIGVLGANKLCCKINLAKATVGFPYMNWTNKEGVPFSGKLIQIIKDKTRVYLYLGGSTLAVGSNLGFDISQNNNNNIRKGISATIGNFNSAEGKWLVTSTDTGKLSGASPYELFFNSTNVSGVKSDILNLNISDLNSKNINFCGDYQDKYNCINDFPPSVANNSNPDCGKTLNCFCTWDNSTSDTGSYCKSGSTPISTICNLNGPLIPGEGCNSSDFRGNTCDTYGHTGGSLSCNNDCTINTTQCTGNVGSVCGNGVIESGETCDGTNFGPITGCSDLNSKYTGGTLSCDSTCHFDTNLCTGPGVTSGSCGNGILNTGESCDSSTNGKTCTNFDTFTGGKLTCYPLGHGEPCKFDTNLCTKGAGPSCGNPGDTCVGNYQVPPGTTCLNTVGDSYGTLSCGSDCQIDTSKCNNGYCSTTQDITTSCAGSTDGLYHYIMKRTWIGDSTAAGASSCINGLPKEGPCPAQIRLSFFSWYNWIVAIIILGIIYYSLEKSKKKRNKKIKQRKKKSQK